MGQYSGFYLRAEKNGSKSIFTTLYLKSLMKKENLLLILTFLAGIQWLTAQITVTNATFPSAGDSLKTASDIDPAGIAIGGSGGHHSWDFTSLSPSSRQVTYFQAASNGAAAARFPNAELVTIGDLQQEVYYDVTATVFANLGISGAEFASGFPVMTELHFNPPLPERHAPLDFLDLNLSNSNATISIPTSAIPGGILDSLGIPSGLLDSIRLRISIQRLDLVDAFGSVAIPGGTYDVLREQRTDYTTTGIDIHNLLLGWVDVTSIIGGGGADLGIGTDTTLTYNFISNTAKEPIASVTVDHISFVPLEVEYKDNGVSALADVIANRPEVVVSPNPISDQATFDLTYLAPGQYTLRLFDVNGQKILETEISFGHESVSLGSLSNGIYFYQLADEKNLIVTTGKLMKVNP